MSKWLMQALFDIYTLISFQWYKEHLNARCFDPCNRTLKFRESQRTPKSPIRECESLPPTLPKVGLRHTLPLSTISQYSSSYKLLKKNHVRRNHQKLLSPKLFKTPPSLCSTCPMGVEEIFPSNSWPPHPSRTNENWKWSTL
jgi:hypothetical protein